MIWKKLGILIKPQKDIDWLYSHAGPSFVTKENGCLVVYVSGRDQFNQSRIGKVYIELSSETYQVLHIDKDAVFDIGQLGTFDESGVSYPWLVYHQEYIYMYYVGWVAGGKNRFQNFTGLAKSSDGGKSYQRVSFTPILDRTNEEPVGTGSCAVFIEDGLWKMYYTAFDKWEEAKGKNKPFYNLKYAESINGVEWRREQKVIIDYKDHQEHIIGKPMIIKENGIYRLWYSHRGPSYRIGYAESTDGIKFLRKDSEVGIDVSSEGWDSEMIEYAFVFDHNGRRYMIYNGNEFGITGLGLAILSE